LLWISGWTFHRTRFFYFQINKKTYFFLLSVFSFVLIFFLIPIFFSDDDWSVNRSISSFVCGRGSWEDLFFSNRQPLGNKTGEPKFRLN
jgi:hypothetical protein